MPLTTEELEELSRLAPAARVARTTHSPTSPAAVASSRYTEILTAAHQRGTSVRELSDQTGISYHSVARRIRNRTQKNISTRGAPAPPTPPLLSTKEEIPSSARESEVPAP